MGDNPPLWMIQDNPGWRIGDNPGSSTGDSLGPAAAFAVMAIDTDALQLT